jgi:Asp-tRNA(Asn)/Glu-tRNA(Gln) amidotransferase C subunit
MRCLRPLLSSHPLFLRLFSTHRYVPAASWDPLSQLAASAPVHVSDAELARLQGLSHLQLPRTGGPACVHERVRGDVAAVLSSVGALKQAVDREGLGSQPPLLEAYLDSLPEEALEALAAQRWARLRPDAVTEAGTDTVTQHASSQLNGYFRAPRFVDE